MNKNKLVACLIIACLALSSCSSNTEEKQTSTKENEPRKIVAETETGFKLNSESAPSSTEIASEAENHAEPVYIDPVLAEADKRAEQAAASACFIEDGELYDIVHEIYDNVKIVSMDDQNSFWFSFPENDFESFVVFSKAILESYSFDVSGITFSMDVGENSNVALITIINYKSPDSYTSTYICDSDEFAKYYDSYFGNRDLMNSFDQKLQELDSKYRK